MKGQILTAILIGATSLLFLADQPRAAAQCNTSTSIPVTYYGYQSVTTTRQTRGTGVSWLELNQYCTSPAGGTVSNGATIQVSTTADPQWTNLLITPPTVYSLAFVEVTGGAGGNIEVPVPPAGVANQIPIVTVTLPKVASPQVAVNAYYFPAGPGGGVCPTGTICSVAVIDEFGETQGTLLNDDFVYVQPATQSSCPTITLTTTSCGAQPAICQPTCTGDVFGDVATSAAVVIVADQTTATGGQFDKWVSAPPGLTDSNPNNLDFSAGTNAYALAFYHSSCPTGYSWSSSATLDECVATSTYKNQCGGTAPLPIGGACGQCGGRWECNGANSVKCSSYTNACGGCSSFPQVGGPQPGENCSCGNGKSGRYACNVSKQLYCDCAP